MPIYSATVFGFNTGATWFDTLNSLATSSSSLTVGIVFDSLPTDVIITAASVGITLASGTGTPGNVTLRIYPVADPDDWTDGNGPGAEDASVTGDPRLDDGYPLTPDDAKGWTLATADQLSAGDTTTFSWGSGAGLGTATNSLQDTFTTLYRGSQWGSKFAFTLKSPGVTLVWGPTVTLNLTTLPIDTGIDGVVGNSRADRCPICGRRSLREEWVMSGYFKRLVCPECWDPKDPDENRRPIRAEDRLGINPEG